MQLSEAKALAQVVVKKMDKHCERIMIGGSIRRNQPEVKDIEIIMIPKMANIHNRTTGWIQAIRSWGHIYKGHKQKGGVNVAKYIQTAMAGQNIKIDFFMATPENWAMISLIRTGPSDFSTQILTRFNKFGYKSDGGIPYLIKDPDIRLSFESEEKIFDFLNIAYLEPELRQTAKIRGVTLEDVVQFQAESHQKIQTLPDLSGQMTLF